MSKTGWKTTIEKCSIATFLGFLVACPLAAREPMPACADATVMPLNASLRSHGDAGVESELFKLEVPAAGLVTVDVAVPGLSEVEAKLGFLGRDGCRDSVMDGDFAVVEQRAAGLALVAGAPGAYLFRVAAQDPRRTLGRYRITTGFMAAEILLDEGPDPPSTGGRSKEDEGVIEIDPDLTPPNPEDKEDEGVIEIDPDLTPPDPEDKEDEGVIEIDPDLLPPDPEDKEDEGVIEIDPDSRITSRGNRTLDQAALRLAWRELCRRRADDHSETPGCATRLKPGHVLAGELDGAWGDDDDFFLFRLSELKTVEIRTSGNVDTLGGLYDRDGQRLAVDDDGGEGANFRLAKTLSPGLYFVRVEGSHSAAGPYTLLVETSW